MRPCGCDFSFSAFNVCWNFAALLPDHAYFGKARLVKKLDGKLELVGEPMKIEPLPESGFRCSCMKRWCGNGADRALVLSFEDKFLHWPIKIAAIAAVRSAFYNQTIFLQFDLIPNEAGPTATAEFYLAAESDRIFPHRPSNPGTLLTKDLDGILIGPKCDLFKQRLVQEFESHTDQR